MLKLLATSGVKRKRPISSSTERHERCESLRNAQHQCSEETMPSEVESPSERPSTKGPDYDFDNVKRRMQKIFKELEVEHATIMSDRKDNRINVIGENISELMGSIKKDNYLKDLHITAEEVKGDQFQQLSIITVNHTVMLEVKCELFLKEGGDHYAFIPAHLFLKEYDFNQPQTAKELQFSFKYPSKETCKIADKPTFLYRHKEFPNFKRALDIAAVRVTERFCFGEHSSTAKILRVTEAQLHTIASTYKKIFLKGSVEIGHVVELGCHPKYDGHFWVKFLTKTLDEGDCGTIMYVNDKDGNEYMLGMFRYINKYQKCYGSTILWHNIDEITNVWFEEQRPFNLQTLDNQTISILCDDQLLESLK